MSNRFICIPNAKPWMFPQPVLVIGTYSPDYTPNAMVAAWAGQWDADKIMISLGAHQTTENLKRCPDFTVAFASKSTMVAADYVGMVSGADVPDKIDRTGWRYVCGHDVKAPIFTDFPMSMECRVERFLDESETGCYVIAKILNIVCSVGCLDENQMPAVDRMGLILYDPVHHNYLSTGPAVGRAFSVGKQLEDKA